MLSETSSDRSERTLVVNWNSSYIAGGWLEQENLRTSKNKNPYNGEIIAEVQADLFEDVRARDGGSARNVARVEEHSTFIACQGDVTRSDFKIDKLPSQWSANCTGQAYQQPWQICRKVLK